MAVPKVSVVIPSYNGGRFIVATLRSVLEQTWRDFELVVIDDASTDDTVKQAQSIHDGRLRIVGHERNVGLGANFNRALREARGEYIKLLPMDDLLYPACLERQVAVLQSDPRVQMVTCLRDIIDAHGKRIVTRGPGFSGRLSGGRAIRRTVRSGTNLFGEPGAVLFRASVLEQVREFDASLTFTIDLDMWCRILLRGSIFAVPEVLCAFRVSSRSTSVLLGGGQGAQFREFVRTMRKQPEYGVPGRDAWCGCALSLLNETGRLAIYRLFLGRRSQAKEGE